MAEEKTQWLRAVVRRPGKILNRATGLPLVKWSRFRPIVLTEAELEDAIEQGQVREADIISTEEITAEDARVARELGHRAKVVRRAATAPPRKAKAKAKAKGKKP